MRELLEDALVVYRQEADGFLTIVAPVAILAPVLAIVASTGFIQALVALPLLLLLCLAGYAACVQGASLVLRSLSPDAGRSYLGVLESAPALVVASAGPGGVLFAGLAGGRYAAQEGFPLVAFALGLAAVVVTIHWAARHAYDQPLVQSHGLSAREALRLSPLLTELDRRSTFALLGAVSAPLAVAAVVCLGLSVTLGPVAAAAVFLVPAALWLPLPALALTSACDRLLDQALQTEAPRASSARVPVA